MPLPREAAQQPNAATRLPLTPAAADPLAECLVEAPLPQSVQAGKRLLQWLSSRLGPDLTPALLHPKMSGERWSAYYCSMHVSGCQGIDDCGSLVKLSCALYNTLTEIHSNIPLPASVRTSALYNSPVRALYLHPGMQAEQYRCTALQKSCHAGELAVARV